MNAGVRFLTLLIIALLIPGCGLSKPYPSKSLFVLPSADLTETTQSSPIALEIPRATVSPPFDTRAFQYRVGETRYEPTYYARWSADPGSLVRTAISRSLASTGAFITLIEGTGSDAPVLLLNVTELYADVRDPQAPLAVVAMQVTLWDRSRKMLMVRDARSERPATSEAPADIVEAWARGMAEITESLVPELRAATGRS